MNLYYREYPKNEYPAQMEQLYILSFPKEEREDMDKLESVIGKGGHQLCFYDADKDDSFVGFVYYHEYRNIRYLGFFAICPELRNKGYGSQILKMLSADMNFKIGLDVEADDPGSEHLEEKKKRKAFYARNGITDTGISFMYRNMHWQVLSSRSMNREEHEALIAHFFPDIAANITYL